MEHYIVYSDRSIWSLLSLKSGLFKYLGAMAISWKICLLFGQYTVDGISHKSSHKFLSLRIQVFVLRSFIFSQDF